MPVFLPEHTWGVLVRSLGFSRREAQIAQLLLASDDREEAMAAALEISPHTVHTHLERLYRKLGVTSRSQVVARMFQRYVELATDDGRRSPSVLSGAAAHAGGFVGATSAAKIRQGGRLSQNS